MKKVSCVVFAICFFLLTNHIALGVILYSSADRNITRPDDNNGGAGWDLQGNWGNYLGTPVASQFFVTAKHVGGNTNGKFHFEDTDYFIDSSFNNGLGYAVQNDLRIWKITGSFSDWAYLYNGNEEAGMAMTIIGRGTQRGSEVTLDSTLKGWTWGTDDTVQSWGRNVISETGTDPNYGGLLAFEFDAAGISNEGQVSGGDSGGGDFIQVGTTWALAGLNLGVTGPYNLSNSGSGFNAAIFDGDGMYYDTTGHQDWVAASGPGTGYSTRISSNVDWLKTFIPASELRVIPEPGTCLFLLAGFITLFNKTRLRFFN
jgi:hypothetical protein